jgi:FXSXX-COOH protein
LADVREVPLAELAGTRGARPRQGMDRVVGHGDTADAVAVAAFQSSI